MWPRLNRWIRTAGFQPDMARLPVLFEEGGIKGKDLLQLLSETTARLQEEVERAEAMARRAGKGRRPEESRGDEDWRQFARSMLPALDALDRLVDMGEKAPVADEAFRNWLQSVKALRVRLTRTMESIGLKPVASVGSTVDLEVHDVVGVVPAGEFPPNTVVAEQLKGYHFRGTLLRDARVVVAQ